MTRIRHRSPAALARAKVARQKFCDRLRIERALMARKGWRWSWSTGMYVPARLFDMAAS